MSGTTRNLTAPGGVDARPLSEISNSGSIPPSLAETQMDTDSNPTPESGPQEHTPVLLNEQQSRSDTGLEGRVNTGLATESDQRRDVLEDSSVTQGRKSGESRDLEQRTSEEEQFITGVEYLSANDNSQGNFRVAQSEESSVTTSDQWQSDLKLPEALMEGAVTQTSEPSRESEPNEALGGRHLQEASSLVHSESTRTDSTPVERDGGGGNVNAPPTPVERDGGGSTPPTATEEVDSGTFLSSAEQQQSQQQGSEAVSSSTPTRTTPTQDTTEETERDGGSPYLVIKKKNITDVSKFESPGLMYASAVKGGHNRDLLKPADEVAEDVLQTCGEEVQLETSLQTSVKVEGGEVLVVSGEEKITVGGGESVLTSMEQKKQVREEEEFQRERRVSVRQMAPIDPGVLVELERHAQSVAVELNHMMDTLRNSLHAMSQCSLQSVSLHRESVDNLHQVVDANIKAMYSFMAKFEELNRNLGPLQEIAAQIREINETLRILERSFRIIP